MNTETATADDLRSELGPWGNHPDFPVEDWMEEVANDYTRLGYWEWVANRLEVAALNSAGL